MDRTNGVRSDIGRSVLRRTAAITSAQAKATRSVRAPGGKRAGNVKASSMGDTGCLSGPRALALKFRITEIDNTKKRRILSA